LFRDMLGWEGEQLIPVDFVMAAYISTFLTGARERTWGDLLGPPSIGKTEILRIFDDSRDGADRRTVTRSELTENAFTSAYRDENNPTDDKSLLFALSYDREPRGPKVLVIPDLSTILNLGRDRAQKFFGEMRSAYDGQFTHQAGNIGAVHYRLGFGVFTACTEKLDEYRKQNQALGERTVICRMGRELVGFDPRESMALEALNQDPLVFEAQRTKIRDATLSAIETAIHRIQDNTFDVDQTASIKAKLATLATLATLIRTSPVSDKIMATTAEGPVRLAKQLRTWADARAAFDGRTSWNEEDYALMRRITQDTMPPEFLRVLALLWDGGNVPCLDYETIKHRAVCDESIYRQLRQWKICLVVTEPSPGNFRLHPKVEAGIRVTELMEGLPNGV
jgi:hypothetical protein